MPITQPKVTFGLFNLQVKSEASFSCTDKQAFSNIDDLRTGNITNKPIITYEPDYWLLDGNYKFKPSTIHLGLMSLSMSDENGAFDTPPQLVITFSNSQTTDGLTIRFSSQTDDYADSINVKYKNASGGILFESDYVPTTWEISIDADVTGFRRIEITFNSTNKPYRYLRVQGVDFGELVYFTTEEIQRAEVIQEIHPLSLELPADELNLRVFSNDSAFSMINPTGAFAKLKENQPLDVYILVDGAQTYIGQYYLKDWKNPNAKTSDFTAIDRLGVIEKLPYLGGLFEDGAWTYGDLLDTILGGIDVPYEFDSAADDNMRGYLPICTYREAVQQIAFAAMAYVTCARSGIMRIIKTTLASYVSEFSGNITAAQKITNQPLELKPLVTGVEVVAHEYYQVDQTNSGDTNGRKVFEGVLPTGQHTIIFDEPCVADDLTFGSANITFVTREVNYCIVHVSSAGNKIIYSTTDWKDSQTTFAVYNEDLDSTTPPNVIRIDKATLVNRDNAQAIAQFVYDYYQQRYIQKIRTIAPNYEPAQSLLIDSLFEQQIGGVVEKMEIDLSGGYISQTEVVGVVAE